MASVNRTSTNNLPTTDWSDIGFKVREVNGHIECHYSTKTGSWSTPEFVTDPFLRIHGLAPGLNYGTLTLTYLLHKASY